MNIENKFLSQLKCLSCNGDLNLTYDVTEFNEYQSVKAELICLSCHKVYPVVEGIPVMFKDPGRIRLLIDSMLYKDSLRHAREEMKNASRLAGGELEQFARGKGLTDALSWEILFWEKWKDEDNGFLKGNLTKINEYLEHDIEGGGRLTFFNKVKLLAGGISNKSLLNIGAGRDYILEIFLEAGCQVVEQDIVLEPLIHLKQRGADFCICCDARQLPFKDNTFDLATSFSVLHHIWPIETPVAELLRVSTGCVHFNEPNFYAFTRLGLLLPGPIKHWLKKLYSGEGSHSPFEKSINPYSLSKILRHENGECIDLTFQKDSWIGNNNKLKKILRAINLIIVQILPLFSAHFDMVIKKKSIDESHSDKNEFQDVPGTVGTDKDDQIYVAR
jgi:uncharacterized protein YbaR (Trm112 family)/2-polyprenyl-3-methyl-5-hydroxy-6-metoxy-1,4-benzoquinol methylase